MQNKAKFIETISNVGGITKKEADSILELVLGSVQQACKEDGGVNLVGVGKVEVVETKASSGTVNGVEWSKPAGKTIKAKISKSFIKEVVGE